MTTANLLNWMKKEITADASLHTVFDRIGYREIYTEYSKIFRELLREKYTPAVQAQISFAARQVGCAIHAFVQTCPHYTIDALVGFVEEFISMQLKEIIVDLMDDQSTFDG